MFTYSSAHSHMDEFCFPFLIFFFSPSLSPVITLSVILTLAMLKKTSEWNWEESQILAGLLIWLYNHRGAKHGKRLYMLPENSFA